MKWPMYGLPTMLLLSPLWILPPSQAKEVSKPIVDVRFDGPYRQVEPSAGDEWAPTWGRDDVLYTANNDGISFGGIPDNAIAFGKLEGDDPYQLKGTTINGMREYREGQLAPELARWIRLDSYKVNDKRYRFVPCGPNPDESQFSCLERSNDDGKSWKMIARQGEEALFRGTKFSAPFFIAPRKEDEAWMGKVSEYAFAAAYVGVLEGEDAYIIGRVPITRLEDQRAADWLFQHVVNLWKPDIENAWPRLNGTSSGPDGANWKTMNTYSVDGMLYMFVTRNTYPSKSDDAKRRHIWQHSSIIMSTDDGRTWTRSAEENLRAPMFPGRRFATAYFVWYGKDGAASVDNADRYVYAVANNGHFENGDDYIIGRVLRTKLSDLSAADWSFYASGDGMQDRAWTANLDEAHPILSNPGRAGMTGVTYIEGLRRYVMVSWHYHRDNFEAGIAAKDLSTVLEFFEAPRPWGPWTKVKSFETGQLGWFAPIVGQRFQTKGSSGSVKAFLYCPGFSTAPQGGLDFSLYKLNYMPITLSTKPLVHENPSFVGGR